MQKIAVSVVRAELANVRKRCFHKKEQIVLTKNNLPVAYFCPLQDKEALVQGQRVLSSATYSCNKFRDNLTFILEQMEAGELDVAEVSYHRVTQFLMVSDRLYFRYLEVTRG